MIYGLKYINFKLLNLLVVCIFILVSVSYKACAVVNDETSSLKVYIPNVSSLQTLRLNYFSADDIEYDSDSLRVSAKGKVEIEQGDIIIRTDSVEYDQINNIVMAYGDVVMLAPDGEVTFADKIELKDEIKNGIVNKFQERLADNNVSMVVEVKNAIVDEYAADTDIANQKDNIKENNSLFSRILSFLTFNTASNTNSLHLADLAPSAGDNINQTNAPIIGNVPLISLQDLDKKETVSPVVTSPIVESEKSIITAPVIVPTESTSIEPTTETSVPITPIKSSLVSDPTTIEKPVPVENPVAPVSSKPDVTSTSDTVPEPGEKSTSIINKESEKKESEKKESEEKVSKESNAKHSKQASKIIPKKNTKKIAEMPLEKLTKSKELTETEEHLSPKTLKLLEKFTPPSSPKESKLSKSLNVDHTRAMQDLFKADETSFSSTSDNALGVKVEVKRPKINLDYELEKAYNALTSGKSDSAIEIYKNILVNSPNDTQALFGLATLYHRARQFDKARPLYGRLLSIDPDNRDGFNNFLVLLADEAPNEALVELEKLEEKNPGFSTIPAQIAIIYQKLGNPDKAIEKMLRAVALAPENLIYRYNLAIMLDKQKNYEEAAKLYRQLVEAVGRGEKIPGKIENIQQRLTFISSNR